MSKEIRHQIIARLPKLLSALSACLTAAALFFCSTGTAASAETGNVDVPGNMYEFEKGGRYEFSEAADFSETNEDNTYGKFSIVGSVSSVSSVDGIPSYEVSSGNLAFLYTYGDSMLNAEEDSWRLIDDKTKKIDTMTIDANIMKGAIILQMSKDRQTWVDIKCITNAFSDTPIRTSSLYTTTDVQLINGCFYRLIVVYEARIKSDPGKILFINVDKYRYKKCAEVYEFYAFTESGGKDVADASRTYSLGSKTRTNHFDGYSGTKAIDKDDVHYGWNLGNFFVSGYTDEVTDSNGNIVFLKNLGDKVTLWFRLEQNINAIKGNANLTVSDDEQGYDQYFETPKMDFGRGVLIVRYTDYNNVASEPIIYTNYLEATASVGADSKVQLFEEGDYEVALDYELTNDKLIDTVGHYRIFFKFSVRNGNCMVYPFDVATGNELTNSSMTDSGFRLDLAMSRYLKVNIKREVLKSGADGLVEDTRFNGPAKDGAEYTDEGVYTITVSNEYTEQLTVKKIYVGTNSVLKAHMTTGLPVSEINKLVSDGATISDEGIITVAAAQASAEQDAASGDDAETLPGAEASTAGGTAAAESGGQAETKANTAPAIVAAGLAAVCLIVFLLLAKKRRKAKRGQAGDDEGDAGR